MPSVPSISESSVGGWVALGAMTNSRFPRESLHSLVSDTGLPTVMVPNTFGKNKKI